MDLGRWGEEMLPREWADKAQHSPPLRNGWDKSHTGGTLLSFSSCKDRRIVLSAMQNSVNIALSRNRIS